MQPLLHVCLTHAVRRTRMLSVCRDGLSTDMVVCLECCLCVSAEMNYNAATDDEPAGEVLLRGPQLFSGYYKQVGRLLQVGCACANSELHSECLGGGEGAVESRGVGVGGIILCCTRVDSMCGC